MALPNIVVQEHEVKLFSQPKPVRFRPYLVKEEKILLMAQQSNDPAEVSRAAKQVIENCTFGALNMTKLPTFDVEYMFIQLRAKSVNNIVTLNFECRNTVAESKAPDGLCHHNVPVTIDLDAIKLTVPEGHTNRVWLTDDVGVILNYPSAELFEAYTVKEEVDVVDLLAACLKTVFTKDGEVHEVTEQTPEEVKTFVERLSLPQIEKLRVFFDTMPHLAHTFTFKCDQCGYEEEVTLSGLMDFFD